MSIRFLIAGGLALVAGAVLLSAVFFRQEAQQAKTTADEPTVVVRGKVSEEEREYSKEYKQLYGSVMTANLADLIARDGGNSKELNPFLDREAPFQFGSEVESAEQILHTATCKADVILAGSVKRRTAHLTEDETFVYTQYEVLVSDVKKAISTVSVESNQTINVTRPGGLIKLNNQVVRLEDRNIEQLEVGKDYLLFLRYVSAANGYMVADYDADFVLDKDFLRPLSKRRATLREWKKGIEREKLLLKVRSAVSVGCK